jgi:hypothetical protein
LSPAAPRPAFTCDSAAQISTLVCTAQGGEVAQSVSSALWEASRRTSFMQKRSKKLLSILHGTYGNIPVLTPTEKSFLVLFFKKEHFFVPRLLPM